LTAAILCFPSHWSLLQKWNMPMNMIHQPVKPYMDNLAPTVASLFKAMKPESPVWRANWLLHNAVGHPNNLYTPARSNHDFSGEEGRNRFVSVYDPIRTGTEITFRAEYQTLLKLKQTNTIVFGIRTYQRYMEEFNRFPVEDSIALLQAIKNQTPDQKDYSGAVYWEDAVVKYLQNVVQQRTAKPNAESYLCSTTTKVGLVVCLVAAVTGNQCSQEDQVG